MTVPFDKSSIIEFFLIEAGEHLQNLNKGLLSLEKDPSDIHMIDELFRAAHTLKGSAAMMGYQGISTVAHKAEDILSMFRARTVPISKETLNFLFDSVDAIKVMVDGVAADQSEDHLVVESVSQAHKELTVPFGKTTKAELGEDEKRGASQLLDDQQSSQDRKDNLDLALEKIFDTGIKEAMSAISLPDPLAPKAPEPALNETPAITPIPTMATVAAPAPVSVPPEMIKPEPPSASLGDSSRQTAKNTAQERPLHEEIEAAKKAGIHEKRGTGRRATDAPDLEKQFIRVNIERLDNLMNLVGEMVVHRNRLARQVEFIKTLREELDFSQERLLHEIKKFEEKYEYTITANVPLQNRNVVEQSADFFELEFDRYDDFNLLSRKLTEITNDTNEIMTELAGFFDSFERDTSRISTITMNLRDEITQTRMVEMDKLYQMFQRPVRDIAREEGKEISMVVLGGDTKIDKTIFGIITDPIMHIIRNAVSHGIEPVAERIAIGKEPAGTLILNARHEGNSIILQIDDDGRGMDTAVLRKTAVDRGIMSQAMAQSLTDLEAINLIFRPGFSTATKITKVSGRGVGMDVVSTNLARINGRIEIKTAVGVGTKFIIQLPLTLAIAQAMIVKLNDQEIAVPMNLVEETTRFAYKDIQRGSSEEMVSLRGSMIRLLKLNEFLGVSKFPKKDDSFRHPALILGMAEKRTALMVEEIIGREEIVVKSLGDYLKGIKLFSGATISGEGNVRLIINIASLFGEESLVAAKAHVDASSREIPPFEVAAKRKPRLLVVDDSISIRKFAQRFLDRAGYEVQVATDGMEALDIMDNIKFDVVITDLEMPVMHGYDLMAEMKKNPALMHIPVIVLTSRAGDKHRQKALEMGAQDYIVKPFEEQDMLGALRKLLTGVSFAG
jgi:chemosensory pili system protein ChpA (sensor histidine kinase/response regulator)